jgi:hypothetical protein
VNATAKTLTLTDVSFSFPTAIENYYISFSTDSYATDYLISSRDSATVLTYSDAGNATTTASGVEWLIKGYKKGEVLYLLSYALNWAPVPQHQEVYRGVTGANE